MTDFAERDDAPQPAQTGDAGIERYLVRHGALGKRRLVGALRPLGLRRGDQAVIQTERGAETAEILLAPGELPRSLAERPPSGEILESLPAGAGALAAEALTPEACQRRERVEDRVRGLVERRAPETLIVEVETLREGRDLIFYLAFEGSHELGRIAVEASTPTVRVRFESYAPPEDEAVDRFEGEAGIENSRAPAADRRPREERFKETADPLVGALPLALATPEERVDYENAYRLQHHGLYVQRRRESGPNASPPKPASRQEAMLRVRIPGGRLAATQFVALIDLAKAYARGELRLTTRQTVQIHGLAIDSLYEAQAALQQAGLASWATCGDTVRNVVACPALPRRANWGAAVRRTTVALDALLQPERSPYERLWADRFESFDDSSPGETSGSDPLFGRDLLPRKFKIALAAPGDCCTDLRTNDLGFEATLDGQTLAGWNVFVGGGLGYSLGRDDTEPRLAEPLGWIPAEAIFDVARGTLLWYRREGDRTDRRRARLKYLVADIGIDAARDSIEAESRTRFQPLRARTELEQNRSRRSPDDHLDRERQDDGSWRRGLLLSAGRLGGDGGGNLDSLRDVLLRVRPALAITPRQNLLFLDLDSSQEGDLFGALADAGFGTEPGADPLRPRALACPALPTCGLALAEAERALPELLSTLRDALDASGLAGESLDFSLTGCPNGCARAYLAELSLVGVGKGRYAIRVGGMPGRDRLNVEIATVESSRLEEALRTIAAWWAQARDADEPLGATVARCGNEPLRERLRLAPSRP